MPRHTGFLLSVLVLALSMAVPASAEEAASRSWLGVRLGGPEAPRVESAEADSQPTGVRVTGVFQDSPADRTGLRAQDRIVAVEGAPVQSNMELIRRVREFEGGSWVTLNVQRDDDDLDFRVRLSDRPADGSQQVRRGWIGAHVVDLTPQLQEHFGAPEKTGVMVGVIRDSSPAFEAGFELGDVIYEIDGHPIRYEKEFMRRVAEAGVGNRAEFMTMRDGVEIVIEALVEVQPQRRTDR